MLTRNTLTDKEKEEIIKQALSDNKNNFTEALWIDRNGQWRSGTPAMYQYYLDHIDELCPKIKRSMPYEEKEYVPFPHNPDYDNSCLEIRFCVKDLKKMRENTSEFLLKNNLYFPRKYILFFERDEKETIEGYPNDEIFSFNISNMKVKKIRINIINKLKSLLSKNKIDNMFIDKMREEYRISWWEQIITKYNGQIIKLDKPREKEIYLEDFLYSTGYKKNRYFDDARCVLKKLVDSGLLNHNMSPKKEQEILKKALDNFSVFDRKCSKEFEKRRQAMLRGGPSEEKHKELEDNLFRFTRREIWFDKEYNIKVGSTEQFEQFKKDNSIV